MEQLRKNNNLPEQSGATSDDADVRAHYKRLAEMKKTYEFWRNIANKKMAEDDQYLPFPNEDSPPVPGQVYKDFIETHLSDVYMGKDKQTNGMPILNDSEMSFLKARIAEFISFSGTSPFGPDRKIRRKPKVEETEGFSLYGTNDEEGLHGGNAEEFGDQDDYDIDELEDAEKFLYDYGPHHIEVEVNNGPASSEPVDPDEPSCEFTFEYDRNGTLVPTDNNIEEKLRLMCLQSQGGEPSSAQTGKKKKSGKKKKKKAAASRHHEIDDSCCLFCQYEAFFGVKPEYTMRWYDKKMDKEVTRRQKVQRKLEQKLEAFRRQQDLHGGSDDTGDSQ